MNDYFLKLFKYNEWANNLVLDAMINLPGDCPEDITSLFNHIVTAQMMWLNRIFQQEFTKELWKPDTVEGCITSSKESSIDWLKFAEGLKDEDLSRVIPYVTTKGVHYENTIEDILIHVINHSTYHRAQIAKLFRQHGETPPLTDYIAYRRKE